MSKPNMMHKPKAQQNKSKVQQAVKKATDRQNSERIIQMQHEFEMWRVQETERIENNKQSLRRQTRQMEQERIKLNVEKAHFHRQHIFFYAVCILK